MKEKFILTFDLEFWHNSEFLKKYLPENNNAGDYILESAEPILELLKKHGHLATFFVLGQIAEKYPELIKKISDSGHEIASHGYSHRTVGAMTPEDFEEEIVKTNNLIKRIVGQSPRWYRSPAFSLKNHNKPALVILEKHGLKHVTRNPAFAGGVYFRVLPLPLFWLYVRIARGKKNPVLYFHLHEFFETAPKINSAPWLKKKIKYIGTKNAWKKFEKLMEKFSFISIEQYLNENSSD